MNDSRIEINKSESEIDIEKILECAKASDASSSIISFDRSLAKSSLFSSA